MTPLLRLALTSLVRHGFTTLAGWLIARGILTDEQASGAVREAVDVAVPLVMVAGAVAWSVLGRKLSTFRAGSVWSADAPPRSDG